MPPRGTKPSVYKLWVGRLFVGVGILSARFAGRFTTSGDNVQAPSALNGEGIGDGIGNNMQALIDELMESLERGRGRGRETTRWSWRWMRTKLMCMTKGLSSTSFPRKNRPHQSIFSTHILYISDTRILSNRFIDIPDTQQLFLHHLNDDTRFTTITKVEFSS